MGSVYTYDVPPRTRGLHITQADYWMTQPDSPAE